MNIQFNFLGGRRILPQIKALIDSGFAVVGHIGLTPQSEAQLGGLRLQGE
jgi:3-methyl-2-oxobutanoate hydroxymethyltransferase